MNHWQQVLRDHDPHGERMSPDAAARMREAVVRTARTASPSRVWPMRVALAAFACVVLMLSALATQHAPLGVPLDTSPAIAAGSERRQIQFATPGGTRIIWEINPDFTLGDTIP
jgi:hypothetical protein